MRCKILEQSSDQDALVAQGLTRGPWNTAFPVREPRGTSVACHSPSFPVISLLSTSFHLLQNSQKHNYSQCGHDRLGCSLTSLAKIIQRRLKSASAGILLAQLADAACILDMCRPGTFVDFDSKPCRNFNPIRKVRIKKKEKEEKNRRGGEWRRHKRRKCALADSETSPVGKAGAAEIIGSVMAHTLCDLESEKCIFA